MTRKDQTVSTDELNEAFRRLARGERFAPAREITRDEAEALLNDEPTPQAHGSAAGGSGSERPAPPRPTDINQLIRELAKGQ